MTVLNADGSRACTAHANSPGWWKIEQIDENEAGWRTMAGDGAQKQGICAQAACTIGSRGA
jgi:hypothetical protein